MWQHCLHMYHKIYGSSCSSKRKSTVLERINGIFQTYNYEPWPGSNFSRILLHCDTNFTLNAFSVNYNRQCLNSVDYLDSDSEIMFKYQQRDVPYLFSVRCLMHSQLEDMHCSFMYFVSKLYLTWLNVTWYSLPRLFI